MPTAIIKLVAHKGDQLLVSYDLVPGEFQIGRDPTCPITLDSPEVSRQHAKLTVTPDRCVLEDIGGKFGTLIEGRQIAANGRKSREIVAKRRKSIQKTAKTPRKTLDQRFKRRGTGTPWLSQGGGSGRSFRLPQ